MSSNDSFIRFRSVRKAFGQKVVYSGLDLTVERGTALTIVGGSGVGKSVMLKMLIGLLKPDAGSVRFDGEEVTGMNERELSKLRQRIAMLFQAGALFDSMSVGENVAVPLRLAGWERGRARARVTELLALVELDPELGPRRPSELSGGQQQRVGVARALAVSPRLMLMDEPFGALDPLTRDRLQQTFALLRRRLGLTAILVTHDMSEALLLGDRVGVMNAGRLVQIGPPAALLRAPADDHVALLLETPRRQARRLDELSGRR